MSFRKARVALIEKHADKVVGMKAALARARRRSPTSLTLSVVVCVAVGIGGCAFAGLGITYIRQETLECRRQANEFQQRMKTEEARQLDVSARQASSTNVAFVKEQAVRQGLVAMNPVNTHIAVVSATDTSRYLLVPTATPGTGGVDFYLRKFTDFAQTAQAAPEGQK